MRDDSLRNVMPSVTVEYSPNQRRRDAVCVSDRLERASRRSKISDLGNVVFRQFGVPPLTAFARPAFSNLVLPVVVVGSNKQVRRVYTPFVVAFVKHLLSFGYGSAVNKPRCSMRSGSRVTSSGRYSTVAGTVKRAGPLPALIAFCYALPKSVSKRCRESLGKFLVLTE